MTHRFRSPLFFICVGLLASASMAQGQRPQATTPLVGGSILETVTPGDLRGHGAQGLGAGFSGIEVQNVGQAGEAPFGTAPYLLWEVSVGAATMGTGFSERCYFAEPIPAPTSPAPLLVLHHRFGKTHLDLPVATDYLAQATARGWYVLEWTLNTNPLIDPARLYAVGFSMGGGMAMNYAARHLDPARPMFAAVANHTGDVALGHVFVNEVLEVQEILGFWFGQESPPTVDPLRLQRASLIEYDMVEGEFLKTGDMVRNLSNMPMYMTRASQDTIVVGGVPYLEIQNDVLDRHIQSELGIPPGPTYQYEGHAVYRPQLGHAV